MFVVLPDKSAYLISLFFQSWHERQIHVSTQFWGNWRYVLKCLLTWCNYPYVPCTDQQVDPPDRRHVHVRSGHQDGARRPARAQLPVGAANSDGLPRPCSRVARTQQEGSGVTIATSIDIWMWTIFVIIYTLRLPICKRRKQNALWCFRCLNAKMNL